MLRTWQRTWRKRVVLAVTVVAIVLLASHPELRLLVPFVDAFGIDLFAILVGSQAWGYVRPLLSSLARSWALPIVRRLYASMIYLLGIAGPGVDATLTDLTKRFAPRSLAT